MSDQPPYSPPDGAPADATGVPDAAADYLIRVYTLSKLLSLLYTARRRVHHACTEAADARQVQHGLLNCVCLGAPAPAFHVQAEIISATAKHAIRAIYPWLVMDDAGATVAQPADAGAAELRAILPCATGVPAIDTRAQALRRLLLGVYEQAMREPGEAEQPMAPDLRAALADLLGDAPEPTGTPDDSGWRIVALGKATAVLPRLSDLCRAFIGPCPADDRQAISWAATVAIMALIHHLASGQQDPRLLTTNTSEMT